MAQLTATKPLNSASFTGFVSFLTSAATGGASITAMSATGFTLTIGNTALKMTGTGFTFASIGVPDFPGLPHFTFPTAGTITSVAVSVSGSLSYTLQSISVPVLNLLSPNTFVAATIFNGSDTLIGSSSADTLNGHAGDDLIRGGGGKDKLDGGGFGGRDKVDYSDKTTSVSLTLSMTASSEVKVNGVVEDTIKNFQDVIGGSGNDVINGDGRENNLYGSAGNDKLFGGAGYDYLRGGEGDDILKSGISDPFGGDVLLGGNGIDTADYSDMTGAISVNLSVKETSSNFWTEVKLNGQFTEWIAQMENLIGGTAGDTLIGDGSRNILRGGGGSDKLDGMGGLDGASFKDKTTGLTVTLNNGAEVSVVVSATETDKLKNIEDVEGGSGDDTLTGDGLANKLYGGKGADTLRGNGADDTMSGGAGSDKLRGDAGKDKFVFDQKPSSTAGFDTIADFAVGQDKIHLSKAAFAELGSSVVEIEFRSGTGSSLKATTEAQNIIYRKDTGELFYDADGSGTAFAQIKFATLSNDPDTLSFSDFLMV